MDNQNQEKSTLSPAIKMFWGIGNGVMVLSTNMASYFQTYWMTDIAKFSVTSIGMITTVSTFLGIFTAPIIGALLDTSEPINRKWGRYRSWLIIGSISAIFTAPLTWIRFSSNETIAAVIRIVIMLIATIPATCRAQSDNALLTIVAKTPNDRSLLASRKFMYSNIFRLISNIVVTTVVAWFLTRGLSEGTSYIVLSILFAILALGGFFVQFKLTEGYEGGENEDKKKTKVTKVKEKASFRDIIKNLLANPPLLMLFVANTLTSCVAMILTRCATYYWKYVAGNFAMMGTYSLIVNGFGILGTIVIGRLSQKFDNVMLSRISLTGMLISIALVKALGLHNPWMFIIVLAVHQFFASCNYPIFVAGYANCTTYAEWRHGKNTAATVMGISGFPLRLAGMVTAWIVPMTLQKVNYVPGEVANETVKAAIVGIYSTWGSIFIAGALIIMLFFYKLNDTKMKQLQADIAERKAVAAAEN